MRSHKGCAILEVILNTGGTIMENTNEKTEQEPVEFPFKKGDMIKNYKEMCDLLGEKYLSGKSKVAQLEIWNMFFGWKNIGHKFLIVELYSPHFINSSKIKNNSKEYYQDMQKILMNMLFNKEFMYVDNAHYVSKSALAKAVGLCNDNYFLYFRDQEKLAKGKNYDRENVSDFYIRSYRMFKRDTLNILKGMENRALLHFSETYVVTPVSLVTDDKKVDADNLDIQMSEKYVKEKTREATAEEIKLIIESKFAVLTTMGFANLSQIYAVGRQEEFKRALKDYLFEFHQMSNVFLAYKIYFPESVFMYLMENSSGSVRLNNQEIINKKKNMANIIRKGFKESIEKTNLKRKEEGSSLPYGYKHKRNLVSMNSALIGLRTKLEQEKFNNEVNAELGESKRRQEKVIAQIE